MRHEVKSVVLILTAIMRNSISVKYKSKKASVGLPENRAREYGLVGGRFFPA